MGSGKVRYFAVMMLVCLIICTGANAKPPSEAQGALTRRPSESLALSHWPGRVEETAHPSSEDDVTSRSGTTGWSFELAPYLWMAGAKADSSVGSVDVSGEADFVDLAKRLDLGAMLHFEGRKERWGFMLDGLYMNLSDDTTVRVANLKIRGIDVDGELEMAVLEAGAFYRFGEAGCSFDALAGARYVSIDVQIESGPLPMIGRDASWIDPFVGGRIRFDLSEKWMLSFRGDVGGFSVGSDLTWNVTALMGYRFSKSTTLAFGYRHLDIDYENGKFDFDAEFSGPYIGLSFRF